MTRRSKVCEECSVTGWVVYVVLSGETILWRAVLGRLRGAALEERSLLISDG